MLPPSQDMPYFESLKLSEDEDHALVYRLYEAERSAVTTKVTLPGCPVRAEETDMLEQPLKELTIGENQLTLSFRAFEIKTVKVYF
jgi:alpha-mannosidase